MGYIAPILLFGFAAFLYHDWKHAESRGKWPWLSIWVCAAAIVALVAEVLPHITGGRIPAIFDTLRLLFDVIAVCAIAISMIARRS